MGVDGTGRSDITLVLLRFMFYFIVICWENQSEVTVLHCKPIIRTSQTIVSPPIHCHQCIWETSNGSG